MKKLNKPKPKLKLDAATVRILDSDKLAAVVGGSGDTCNINPSQGQLSCTHCAD
jgi:hypothetical protein